MTLIWGLHLFLIPSSISHRNSSSIILPGSLLWFLSKGVSHLARPLIPAVHLMKEEQEHGGDDESHPGHEETSSIIAHLVYEESWRGEGTWAICSLDTAITVVICSSSDWSQSNSSCCTSAKTQQYHVNAYLSSFESCERGGDRSRNKEERIAGRILSPGGNASAVLPWCRRN